MPNLLILFCYDKDGRFRNTAIESPGHNPQFPRERDVPGHMGLSKEELQKDKRSVIWLGAGLELSDLDDVVRPKG